MLVAGVRHAAKDGARRELVWTWYHNRCRRVLEEDYGSVSSGPGRANAFVGSLGVSFLTA